MVLSVKDLEDKLAKEIEKKTKAEEQIKKLKFQIEQAKLTEIKVVMEEHNVSFADLKELIKSL